VTEFMTWRRKLNFYLIADTHFKHEKMTTYCQRPADFSEILLRNLAALKQTDTLIHLGDVGIGKYEDWLWMLHSMSCKKILIRGNHDRQKSVSWWCDNGFDFACDGMMFRNWWLSHEPANSRPGGCEGNIHGHLHNIWDGFHDSKRVERDRELLGFDPTHSLKYPWQRLFACEYTNYMPVEFDKFVSKPDKYQARGPK
jgi:calcineurin-like phosphoesterase family protein